jgi:hypothetical protein
MTDEPKPQFTDDELAHMKGQEAEEFIRFFDEGQQYFKGVMASIQEEIKDEIMSLSPHETERFTILKARLESLYDPLDRVAQDIRAGKMAWARMNSIIDKTEGIL